MIGIGSTYDCVCFPLYIGRTDACICTHTHTHTHTHSCNA